MLSILFLASVQSSILNTFLRLHDVPNPEWIRSSYGFDQHNLARSHDDCGVVCALEFPSKCQFYVQDHQTCNFGTLGLTSGTYNAIGATRHVYVDSGNVNG